MADIPYINQRQSIVTDDGKIDRNLSLLINAMALWINENSQAGTTLQRPTLNLYIGRAFFDTDVGDMIHIQSLNPTVWVKGGGVPV
jgi:hypothetical protein